MISVKQGCTNRRRTIAIAAVLMAIAAAQGLSLLMRTNQLWPFNSVAVYYNYADKNRAASNEVFLVDANGETRIAATGLADRNLSQRFISALERAKSKPERDRVAKLFFDFANGRATAPFRFTGLRMYRKDWDLAKGRVVESVLLAEYLKR
jgi:hypothetical protein